MADEANEADAGASPGKSGSMKAVVIIGIIMLVEGVGVYGLTRLMAPPPPAADASEDEDDAISDELFERDEYREIELSSCRPTNRNGAKTLTVSISVTALVREVDLEGMQKLVENMQGRIDDRVNFVVRSVDQRHLNEAGLEVIKRQLKHELDGIFGDEDLIVELLIPELLQTE